MSDPVLDLRTLITANDAAIVELVNERLRLVGELWRIKAERGVERADPERERHLRAQLAAVNTGPLSDESLNALVDALLALTKRELDVP